MIWYQTYDGDDDRNGPDDDDDDAEPLGENRIEENLLPMSKHSNKSKKLQGICNEEKTDDTWQSYAFSVIVAYLVLWSLRWYLFSASWGNGGRGTHRNYGNKEDLCEATTPLPRIHLWSSPQRSFYFCRSSVTHGALPPPLKFSRHSAAPSALTLPSSLSPPLCPSTHDGGCDSDRNSNKSVCLSLSLSV